MRPDIVPGAVSRERAVGPPWHAPHALGVAARRSAGAGALSPSFCPKHRDSTEASCNSTRDASRSLPPRDDLDRQPDRHEGVRTAVGAEWTFLSIPAADCRRPRHPRIHRPGPQLDDPSQAGARARPAWLPDLQRLLRKRTGTSPRQQRVSVSHDRSFVRGCASTGSYKRWPTAELTFIVESAYDQYQSLMDFGCRQAHSLPATHVKGESQRVRPVRNTAGVAYRVGHTRALDERTEQQEV